MKLPGDGWGAGYFRAPAAAFALRAVANLSDSEAIRWSRAENLAQSAQRRSERVLLDVSVIVSGELPDHRTFQEETFTVTVSAHGALMMLATRVRLGQKLVVTNATNHTEREGRVAYLGAPHAGLSQVAVEFSRPAPDFWPVACPPPNWRVP